MKRLTMLVVAVSACANAQQKAEFEAAQQRAFSGPCTQAEYADKKFRLDTERDAFEGSTKTRNRGFSLDPGLFSEFGFHLQRYISKGSDTTFQAFVGYKGKDWFFIEEGIESLVVLVDSTRFGFRPLTTPDREVQSSSGAIIRGTAGTGYIPGSVGVYEMAAYQVPRSFVRAVAGATTVQVRVVGSKGYRDFKLSREGFCSFARFVSDAVP